ncbi:MAG: hypothetical protein Hens3KO_13230 [Henriciella sp.]
MNSQTMSVSSPFQLTSEDVRRAGLLTSDAGMWCVCVDGCYHLFETEDLAYRAHSLMMRGQMVR